MLKIKRIATASAAAALASSLVFPVSTPAMAEEGKTQTVSIESYTENLKSQNDEDAKEVLEEFENLPQSKKNEYISLLNNPDFIKAIYSSDVEKLQKYGVTVTTKSYEDVPSSTGLRTFASNVSHKNTYVHQMDWGPIKTVKLEQTYAVTGNGASVVSSDSCVAANTNYTGVGNITESTVHQKVGENGECRTNWKASIPTPLGSVDLASVQEQQINGAGKVIKENFYDI